jgi:anti-sigma B factor antagonist
VVPVASTSDEVRRRLDREYVVVRSPDELDLETAPPFAQRLLAIEPNTDIAIDLRELTFCGSTGIAMLLEVERVVKERGSSLTLSYPPPILDRLLQACGLEDHFTVRRPPRRRARRAGGADPSRR